MYRVLTARTLCRREKYLHGLQATEEDISTCQLNTRCDLSGGTTDRITHEQLPKKQALPKVDGPLLTKKQKKQRAACSQKQLWMGGSDGTKQLCNINNWSLDYDIAIWHPQQVVPSDVSVYWSLSMASSTWFSVSQSTEVSPTTVQSHRVGCWSPSQGFIEFHSVNCITWDVMNETSVYYTGTSRRSSFCSKGAILCSHVLDKSAPLHCTWSLQNEALLIDFFFFSFSFLPRMKLLCRVWGKQIKQADKLQCHGQLSESCTAIFIILQEMLSKFLLSVSAQNNQFGSVSTNQISTLSWNSCSTLQIISINAPLTDIQNKKA